MSLIRHSVCFLWLAASALAGTTRPPNVILITMDTTRADRMGFLGSKRGLTPNLDAMARQAAIFTHAYAQAPLTSVSHASILTGTYPQFHQVLDFPYPLANDLPYASQILRAQGYHTAAFIGSLALDPTGGAPGFDRGFDTYDANFHAEDFMQKGRYQSIERRGAEVVAHALTWLREHPKGPFFLWIHLYDAHDPYEPPEPYRTKYASEPYDGAIAYVDSVVGKLLRQLKTRGLYDGALIAITADHGESLGAHGEDTHGIFLYDETIQVPLLIKLPRPGLAAKRSTAELSAGQRIDSRVELIDILPTLLRVTGIEIPSEVQGESLLALIEAGARKGDAAPESWRDRPAYAQADYPHIAYGWSALQSLRTGKYLYIQAPRRELYDAAADPKAEHDLSSVSPAVASTLAGQLALLRQKTSSTRELGKPATDPDVEAKLAALGYIASSHDSKAEAPGAESDPKDNIETMQLVHRTTRLLEDQRFADAVPLLQQLLAKKANAPILYSKLGECYLHLHQYDQALLALHKALELNADSLMVQMDLGLALVEAQDFAAAVPELERVVARAPRSEQGHLVLANAYTHTNRLPEAIKQYEEVLAANPDHYLANLLLGRALVLVGEATAAIAKLKKAAVLQPNAAEPHLALSNAYLMLGDDADAAQEQIEARQRIPGAQ
ncbi:MAG: sulfatase-like hydrolase/transferase [Terriglobales bacterium]